MPITPQYAKYAVAISSAAVTIIENQRTLRLTPSPGARHNEIAPATEAIANTAVAAHSPIDHIVTLPSVAIGSSSALKIAAQATRLSTATSGHSRIPRSAGRRRFLRRPPNIQNGA